MAGTLVGTLPLTRRAMAAWPRWITAATDWDRRRETSGLHPDEVAALQRLAANLDAAGAPKDWFRKDHWNGLALEAGFLDRIFCGLSLTWEIRGDLVRALETRAKDTFIGAAAILEQALLKRLPTPEKPKRSLERGEKPDHPNGVVPGEITKFASAEAGKGRPWSEYSPAIQPFPAKAAGRALREQELQQEETKTPDTRETQTTVRPPAEVQKWRAGETVFGLAVEAAGKLGISLAELPIYRDRMRIARQIGYSESTTYLALKEYMAGRRQGEQEAAPVPPPVPEPAPIEVAITRREPEAATTTEETTHPVTVLRQGEAPVTEQQPAEVTRLVDQQMGDGGHLPVDVAALEAERNYNSRLEDWQSEVLLTLATLGYSPQTKATDFIRALATEREGWQQEVAAFREALEHELREDELPAQCLSRLLQERNSARAALSGLNALNERVDTLCADLQAKVLEMAALDGRFGWLKEPVEQYQDGKLSDEQFHAALVDLAIEDDSRDWLTYFEAHAAIVAAQQLQARDEYFPAGASDAPEQPEPAPVALAVAEPATPAQPGLNGHAGHVAVREDVRLRIAAGLAYLAPALEAPIAVPALLRAADLTERKAA